MAKVREFEKVPPITDEEVERFIELANQGMSLNEMSKATGRSFTAISIHLKKRGVDFKKSDKHTITEQKKEIALQMLKERQSIIKIAQTIDVSKDAVSLWNKKWGYPGYRDEEGKIYLPNNNDSEVIAFLDSGKSLKQAARYFGYCLGALEIWAKELEVQYTEAEREDLYMWLKIHWKWKNPKKPQERPRRTKDGKYRIVYVGEKMKLRTPTHPDGIWS